MRIEGYLMRRVPTKSYITIATHVTTILGLKLLLVYILGR
jgi:hypothetical protein